MKFLKTTFVSLLILSTVFHSSHSKAAVGSIAATPAAVAAGVLIAEGAAGIEGVAIAFDVLARRGGSATICGLIIAIPFAIIGLLILDGEQTMKYATLSKEEGKKLQLTSHELIAYNSELDQLNALASYVDEEISRDGEVSPEESAEVWNQVKTSVSPEAFTAFAKINKQMFAK